VYSKVYQFFVDLFRRARVIQRLLRANYYTVKKRDIQ
jgi:hypothetical protein